MRFETATPRISVVTPTRNQAPYIEATILSVLEQDYPDFEYIVIDGDSDDGTQEIIRRHQDRISYWVSEPDRGQGHALNKGFARASGQLLAYINSDDFYLPGALATFAALAVDHPEADLFHGRCQFVSEDGTPTGSHFGSVSSLSEVLDLWDVWWAGKQVIQPEVCWSRSLAEKVGPFREDVYFGMDFDYWCRAFAQGARMTRRDAPVCSFRVTPVQKTSDGAAVAQELLDIVRAYLWDSQVPLDHACRRTLQGKWLYQRRFLAAMDQAVQAGENRWKRWARGLGVVVRHPKVVLAPQFRRRLAATLR